MSITSTKKFEKFQSVPLKECGLRDVPGVGEVAENKLKDANIDDACKIIGHFREIERPHPFEVQSLPWSVPAGLGCAVGIRCVLSTGDSPRPTPQWLPS